MCDCGYVLANRDGRSHRHTTSGCNHHEAGICYLSFLWNRVSCTWFSIISLNSTRTSLSEVLEKQLTLNITTRTQVLDAKTGKEIEGNGVEGVLCVKKPWPGMARTVFGDHQRYLDVYMRPYKNYYFTGDGVRRDKDGYYWITGRVDDVLNISGHRIGTAEIESALVLHDSISESAVVGYAHDIKGQGMACYCVLMASATPSDELIKSLKVQVRSEIGPFATPDKIIFVPGLPKTRSGKVMRRLLRKVVSGVFDTSKLGDVSTLADPSVVSKIIDVVKASMS